MYQINHPHHQSILPAPYGLHQVQMDQKDHGRVVLLLNGQIQVEPLPQQNFQSMHGLVYPLVMIKKISTYKTMEDEIQLHEATREKGEREFLVLRTQTYVEN